MTERKDRTRVDITDAGRSVATAEVVGLQAAEEVQASLHVEAGHHPVGSRRRLVDAVLDLPEVEEGTRLHATIPMGDAEILEQVYDRCADVRTRPAGATCIVDAEVRGG